jgi:tRNA (mo5U34)-methyltransferase
MKQAAVSRQRTESWTREEIRARVAELGEWFHNLNLAGVATAPHHFLGDYPSAKWRGFQHAIPQDLKGASVLDVGCNAGFYSIEMKRRGADRVVGIDSSDVYLAQARFATEVCGVNVELKKLSVYEVAQLKERFDLVLFMGVLYHLRHPLLALDLLHEHVVKDTLVFQTLQRGREPDAVELSADYPFSETAIFEEPGTPRAVFIEGSYAGDPTNWWVPNPACSMALLRSAGFELLSRPEPEVYVCRTRALSPIERELRAVPGMLP